MVSNELNQRTRPNHVQITCEKKSVAVQCRLTLAHVLGENLAGFCER